MRKVSAYSLRWLWLRCLSLVLVFLILLLNTSIESNASGVATISDTEEYVEVQIYMTILEDIDITASSSSEILLPVFGTGTAEFTLPNIGSYLITEVVQTGYGYLGDNCVFSSGEFVSINADSVLCEFDYNREAFDYGGENLKITATMDYGLTVMPTETYYNNLKIYGVKGSVNSMRTATVRIYYKSVENYTEGQKIDKVDQTLQEQHETQKGILAKITEFFGSFFQNFIDSVIGLFVPTAEDMNAIFERLDTFFEETFGFLYYPFQLLGQFLGIFRLTYYPRGITFPGFSIMGYEIWGDITVNLVEHQVVKDIFTNVRKVTDIIIIMWVINYLKNFFNNRFGGGGR